MNLIISESEYSDAYKEKTIREYSWTIVYFIITDDNKRVKIGITDYDPRRRLKELQTSSPYKLRLLSFFKASCPYVEKRLHIVLDEYRITGEWFLAKQRVLNYALLAKLDMGHLIEYLLGEPFNIWATGEATAEYKRKRIAVW